jgi:hypothetical protein
MYCDLWSNRTGAYCPTRGYRKFTKQSLEEHAARYHTPREVGSHDVRQQLTEEQLRIRTRLVCILLTVLFLARQHIALPAPSTPKLSKFIAIALSLSSSLLSNDFFRLALMVLDFGRVMNLIRPDLTYEVLAYCARYVGRLAANRQIHISRD